LMVPLVFTIGYLQQDLGKINGISIIWEEVGVKVFLTAMVVLKQI